MHFRSRFIVTISKFFFICMYCVIGTGLVRGQDLRFTEVSKKAGLNFIHDYEIEQEPVYYRVTAAHAIGDYNNDGFQDIYVETGDIGANLLYKNNGDGTFTELGVEAGVGVLNDLGACPFFVDYDNDGYQDLLLGGLEDQHIRFFHNIGGESFEEVLDTMMLDCNVRTYSFSAGDYDKDGDLDLFLTHWQVDYNTNHLWENQANHTFINVDEKMGLFNPFGTIDNTFTGNFTDFNNDGWVDLLITSDFGTSQIWVNNEGNSYRYETDKEVINDENGMGSAIGDYNNDGLLDWFVSAVYDWDGVTEGNWGASGNRLYRNSGNNEFENITDENLIRNGSWGWGASAGDLNNDGFLDIVHTNGWPKGSDQFYNDSTRIFLSKDGAYFRDVAHATALIDTLQGRGLSLFDYDKDGDLDIFISNYRDKPSLWRNDLNSENGFLSLKLVASNGLTPVGAKVFVYSNGQQQMRELRCGTNYNAQNPLEMHFGLGNATIIDSLAVLWPDGTRQMQYNVSIDQFKIIHQDFNTFDRYQVIMYPNPFNQWFKINVKGPSEATMTLRLFDLNGVLKAESSNYTRVDNSYEFHWVSDDLNRDLPNGSYFIHILVNDRVKYVKKILKQRP